MNDAQTKTNKNNTIKSQYTITENQEKELQIHRLSSELNNTKNDLKRLMDSAPDIESLYKKLNESNDKIHNLECTISSLKTRVKQLQIKNNELKGQVDLNTKNKSAQISQIETKFRQQQIEVNDFLHNLSQIIGNNFSSFNDIMQYIKLYKLQRNNNNSEIERLKVKNKKIKSTVTAIKEERDQIQNKLDEVLKENEERSMASDKNKLIIDSFENANNELKKQIESTSIVIEKLKQKNRKLKRIIKEISSKNYDLNEPRILQLQQFLQQKTNDFEYINKQLSSLNMEKNELERQVAILAQKGKEYISYKQIAQKEISKLKMTINNDEEERKLLTDKISRIELENVSLLSQFQSANQKCILLTARIQEMETESRNAQNDQNEFNGMIKIFEKVIDSQKKDLSQAISVRNMLAEKVLIQTNLLSRGEELLSKQIEQNRLLKAKLKSSKHNPDNNSIQNNFFKTDNIEFDQNSSYLLLGYIKELLLPEIPPIYQINLLSILNDSSLSIVQRIKQVFHLLISKFNAPLAQPNLFNQSNPQSFYEIKNKQKIIDHISKVNNIDLAAFLNKVSMTPDVFNTVITLISMIENYENDLQQLKEKMEYDMKKTENLGCENINQMKKCFENMKQKCASTEEKLKEYREIARVLKNELQKKLNEIDQIKLEYKSNNQDSTILILKKEITKMKSSEKDFKSKINKLRDESDDLRLKLQNSINEIEKIKQKSINDLNEQKIKYEALINKINADSTSDFSSTKLMIADIQRKYEKVEQRYQNELNMLRNQIEEQNKSKNEITLKYQKQAEESENLMNELVKKFNDSRVKIEKLKKENSQIKLEKKALEFQLEMHSNHETCFATMLEKIPNKKNVC